MDIYDKYINYLNYISGSSLDNEQIIEEKNNEEEKKDVENKVEKKKETKVEEKKEDVYKDFADKSKLAHSFKYIDREIHLIEILSDESVYKSTLTSNSENNTNTDLLDKIIISNSGYYIISTPFCNLSKVNDVFTKLDPNTLYNYYLNSTRQQLIFPSVKSELIVNYPNCKNIIYNYISQPSSNQVLDNDLLESFVNTSANLRRNTTYNEYFSELGLDYYKHFNKYDLNKKYKIINIPGYIYRFMNQINSYFEEIKDMLIFNEKTGYYDMLYKTDFIPIICKHKYMMLNKDSMTKIIDECVVKGNCKYCGENIVNYDENISVLSTEINLYIYSLLEAHGIDSSNTILYNYLFNYVSDLIIRNVKPDDPNYENKSLVIVALFVWGILKLKLYKENVSKLITKISSILFENGFNEEKIEQVINKGMLGDLSSIAEQFVYEPTSSEYNLENIFNISDKDIIDLKKNGLLDQFNQKFKLLRYKHLCTELKLLKMFDVKTLINLMYINERFNFLELFIKYSKLSCIKNKGGLHKFEKDICIYCGLTKDMKNINDIYFDNAFDYQSQYIFEIPKDKNKYNIEYFNLENVFKLNIDSVKKELSKKLNVNTFDQIYYNIKQNIYRISNRLNIITRVEHNYTPDEVLKMVYFINTDNALELLKFDSSEVIVTYGKVEKEDNVDEEM